MPTERLRVVLELVTDKYKASARDAASATDGITKSGGAATASLGKFSASMSATGTALKGIAAAAATVKIGQFLSGSVAAASDLEESVNAVGKVFDDASGTITRFGEGAARSVGLSARAFNELATGTGALLTNVGFSANAAAAETIKLTQRAADMASVFNTDVEDALTAVQAGLRGETEPLRKFGVSLDDASIRAKAVELGLAATTKEVDRNAKATAALQLIYEQTNKTAGDFIQTSDGLANAQRVAAAELENAQASFGRSAAPILADLTGFASKALLAFRSLAGDDVAEASFRVTEAMENITIGMRDGVDRTILFQESLAFLARNIDLTTDELRLLGTQAGISLDDLGGLHEIIDIMGANSDLTAAELGELHRAVDGLAVPAGEAAAGMGELSEEEKKVREEAAKAIVPLSELFDLMKSQADPVFAAVDAYQRYLDTLAQVDEDGKRSAQEQLDLAAAVLESEAALRKLGGGNLEKGIEAIATALSIGTEEARALLVELGLLDGKTVTSIIDVRVRGGSTRPGGSGDRFRAHGGPVHPGDSYMVGERGPELFTPNTAGRIIANGQPSTPTITINQTFQRVDGDHIDQDIQRGVLLSGLTRIVETL